MTSDHFIFVYACCNQLATYAGSVQLSTIKVDHIWITDGNCGDGRPPVATSRSQVTRFRLIRFNAIQEGLSQESREKIGTNRLGIWVIGNNITVAFPSTLSKVQGLLGHPMDWLSTRLFDLFREVFRAFHCVHQSPDHVLYEIKGPSNLKWINLYRPFCIRCLHRVVKLTVESLTVLLSISWSRN
jgi:hypothetical protein